MRQALSNRDPLAVRVIFDQFNSGSDAADPSTVEDFISKWRREGVLEGSFVKDLVAAKLRSYSAGLTFLFIMFLTVDLIWEEAQMAFF